MLGDGSVGRHGTAILITLRPHRRKSLSIGAISSGLRSFDTIKVVVLGAGAIGSVVATLLAKSPNESEAWVGGSRYRAHTSK